MKLAIVICPFCSLLTYEYAVAFPRPYCVHVVLNPPIKDVKPAVICIS